MIGNSPKDGPLNGGECEPQAPRTQDELLCALVEWILDIRNPVEENDNGHQ